MTTQLVHVHNFHSIDCSAWNSDGFLVKNDLNKKHSHTAGIWMEFPGVFFHRNGSGALVIY
jgi:hypothetical protein